jgi:hypothetical protein
MENRQIGVVSQFVTLNAVKGLINVKIFITNEILRFAQKDKNKEILN